MMIPTALAATLLSILPAGNSTTAEAATWVDLDGNQRKDLVFVSNGRLFVYLTDAAGLLHPARSTDGLSAAREVRSVAIVDLDRDQRPELFITDQAGGRRLLEHDGLRFHDCASDAGLGQLDPASHVDVFDIDDDGDEDLVTRKQDGSLRLFINDGNGVLVGGELALPEPLSTPPDAIRSSAPNADQLPEDTPALDISTKAANGQEGSSHAPRVDNPGRNAESARQRAGTTESATIGSSSVGVTAQGVAGFNALGCAQRLRDQATGDCLEASSEPLAGLLYPLSEDFMVSDFFGWIGMGTLEPQTDLHIHGGLLTQLRLSGSAFLGDEETAIQLGLDRDFDEGMTLRANTFGLEINSQRLTGPGESISAEFGPHVFVSRDATTAVGIGERSPQTTLHVGGDGTFEDSVDIRRPNDFVSTVTLDPGSTTAEGGTLVLANSSGATGVQLNGDLGTGANLQMFRDDGLRGLTIDADSGGAPVMTFFKANNAVGIVLDANLAGDARITTEVLEITGGADLAESFDTGGVTCAPGTVMVIDPERPGELTPAVSPYDPRVAGVVSGAGGVQPGLHLGQAGVVEGSTPIALTGRVYVRTSTENGPVRPGDLLTTSSTPGHAMRATDRERSFGAILGKAMSERDPKSGLVLVLVSLQ